MLDYIEEAMLQSAPYKELIGFEDWLRKTQNKKDVTRKPFAKRIKSLLKKGYVVKINGKYLLLLNENQKKYYDSMMDYLKKSEEKVEKLVHSRRAFQSAYLNILIMLKMHNILTYNSLFELPELEFYNKQSKKVITRFEEIMKQVIVMLIKKDPEKSRHMLGVIQANLEEDLLNIKSRH